jgi:cell volume regulation protein A
MGIGWFSVLSSWDPVDLFLVCIATVFLVGVVGELIFQRTNVPDVIWLIVVGLILGPFTGIVDRSMLGRVAPFFGALTLVIVLFDGGVRLRIGELVKAAPRSGALAVLGFILSVLSVALLASVAAKFGMLPEGWTLMHGLILGSIVGGASSVVIMPALDQAGVEPGLGNMLKLESALTDVLCVVGTVTLVELAVQGAVDKGQIVATLGSSFGMGIGIGGVGGLLWMLLHRIWGGTKHEYPITLAGLLVLYVVVNRAGGSAALGILTCAVVIGNATAIARLLKIKDKPALDLSVERFHGVVTFMIKSFFFTFIGLMMAPPWSLIFLGVLIAGVLLAVRVPTVLLATRGAGLKRAEKGLVIASLPRGMAAGVLAILPFQAGLVATEGVPVMVFACVFTTILVFAVGFPYFTGLMASADPEADSDDAELSAEG